MAHLTLRFLGGFEAHLATGTPVDIPTKKAKALLAYLALYQGKRQSREKLATLLWENSGDERARVNLRQALRLLRKSVSTFEGACIASEGDALYLDPDHAEVDVWEFEKLCNEATPDALTRATELYRGELLEGFGLGEAPFEEWLEAERAKFHGRAVDALRSLQSHRVATSDSEQGIAVAVRLLALDPLQEDVHRSLMRLYADSGERVLALRQYQTCCDVLMAELGLTPDEETERLHEKIRRGHPADGEELDNVDALQLPETPSIAILPFKNLSGDPEQDYLADGFHFDIQAALVRVTGLFLIASGTVSSYRNKRVSAETAGREMGVRYILEAGVRKTGQRIYLTVQLTDTVLQQVIWAGKYDQALEDASTMQDEIAAAVLEALSFKLLTGEESRVFQSTLTNPEARDCFYRALSHPPMMSKDGNAAARKLFENVIRLQPDSPVGPTYMAFSYWLDVFREWTDSKKESLEQAVKWANKALEFEGTNGLAHIVLAYVHLMNRRHDEALATGFKAVQLRPSCPTAIGFLANILLYCERSTEAITRTREAMRLSPLYPPWLVNILAAAYRSKGDIGSSVSVARQAIEMDPSDINARLTLCDGYHQTDRRQQAASLVREVLAIDPRFSVARYVEGQPYKDQKTLDRLAASFREAGLPD